MTLGKEDKQKGKLGTIKWRSASIIVMAILVLLILGLIIGLIERKVTTGLERAFFSFFITIFSTWLGYLYDSHKNKAKEEENFLQRWLPAAQNACYELVTMSAEAKRLQESHERACEAMAKVFPDISKNKLEKMKALIGLKCHTCAENMTNLRNRIDNGLKQWETFVDYNCKEPICKHIHKAINKRKEEVGIMDNTFDQEKCNC